LEAYSFDTELLRASLKLVRDVLKVREDESVIITADTRSDLSVVRSVAQAVSLSGAKPMVVLLEAPRAVGKAADRRLPVKPLSAALREADVWVEFNKYWLLYSTPYEEALAGGKVRYMCLVGMDSDMLVRTLANVDVSLLIEFERRLAELTRRSRRMRITNRSGTDVSFENDPERPVFVEGVVSGPGEYMLIGQVDWAPVEETINGTIVFDGSVWPPEELGLLREPIKLEVEGGVVKGIEGGSEARVFESWLRSFNDPKMFNVAHISYGCNPGAKLTGNILEDERIWGAVEWGLGNQAASFKGKAGPASSHTDGITLAPTLSSDVGVIIREGEYVHPELVDLAKKLRPR